MAPRFVSYQQNPNDRLPQQRTFGSSNAVVIIASNATLPIETLVWWSGSPRLPASDHTGLELRKRSLVLGAITPSGATYLPFQAMCGFRWGYPRYIRLLGISTTHG